VTEGRNPSPGLLGDRIAVTGADGFIGRHVVRALAAAGARRIVAIDRRPVLATTFTTEVSAIVPAGERTILEPIDDLLDGIDVVIHLAGHVSPPKSVEDPRSDAIENILGTICLLESCRRVGVRRIVYASSAAVYGRPTSLPVDERHQTLPESPYGQSKLAAEQYCLLYGRLHGLSVIALRYSSVYGPGQPLGGGYAGVIRLFLDRINRGLPLLIEGDGSQTRDFVHVSDVVRANLLAAASTYEGILNIGDGNSVTISEVAIFVAGPDYPIEYRPARVGDIPHLVADVAAAREKLGFGALVPLARGLHELKLAVAANRA
jgi:UDP-glucose 4-epimerase